jgi:hypothetical protein
MAARAKRDGIFNRTAAMAIGVERVRAAKDERAVSENRVQLVALVSILCSFILSTSNCATQTRRRGVSRSLLNQRYLRRFQPLVAQRYCDKRSRE